MTDYPMPPRRKSTAASVAAILGLLTGTLSFVSLLQYAILKQDFTAPLHLVLTYFRSFMDVMLGWLDPIVLSLLAKLGALFNIRISLAPHWKYIYVLLWLYFGAYARVYWSQGEKRSAVFSFLFGGLLALLAGVTAGLDWTQHAYAASIIFWTPVSALVLFELGVAVFNFGFENPQNKTLATLLNYTAIQFVLPQMVIPGLVYAAMLRLATEPDSQQEAGLVGLFALSALMAVYWIVRVFFRTPRQVEPLRAFLKRVKDRAGYKIGTLMLGTIAGALLFLLANAGLSRLGL